MSNLLEVKVFDIRDFAEAPIIDLFDIGKTIHPHPTLGETVGMAAEVAHGTCTDVPPPRKK